jgi:hypothetical protein
MASGVPRGGAVVGVPRGGAVVGAPRGGAVVDQVPSKGTNNIHTHHNLVCMQ